MLSWIFNDEEYTAMYHEYLAELIETYFDSGYFDELVDRAETLIAHYVQEDPTKFCTYEEFEKGVETLRKFCTLRAESVKGQLDGTIPSTSDGQEAEPDRLIDASGISISDMGSMNTGMGRGGGQLGEDGQEALPAMNEVKSFEGGFGRARMENQEDDKPQSTAGTLFSLGISAAVLIVGLTAAFKFRR